MNELITPEIKTVQYQINNLTTQALKEELAKAISLTASHLVYLAAIWKELENRGEDLSQLRTGLTAYLPQIAAGQVDAEVVIQFAGQPLLLRALSLLPLDEQQKIARGKPINVLKLNSDGVYETQETPAYSLTAAQTRLVFGQGKIRNKEEQIAVIESARIVAHKLAKPTEKKYVRYDAKLDKLFIGRSSASIGEIIAALVESQNEENTEEEREKLVAIKLTEDEHTKLKIRAAESRNDIQSLVRGILMKFKLI